MPIAWFACTYKRRDFGESPGRYCAMDDFTSQILADGGSWDETEILGGYAIVKVNASDPTLTAIANTNGFWGVPRRWVSLTGSLSDMTNGERNQIASLVLSLGYTQSEIDSAMGSTLNAWQTHTLFDLLNMMATRRLKPRYDSNTDQIILDGPEQPVKSITVVDSRVR